MTQPEVGKYAEKKNEKVAKRRWIPADSVVENRWAERLVILLNN